MEDDFEIDEEIEDMKIIKCNSSDIPQLAVFNKQLIEDEKSDNPMSVPELEKRMENFLNTEYDAYFFEVDKAIVGYALVKKSCSPLYLRQFFIGREYRKNHCGTEAFHALLNYLNVDSIDIEVLSGNEPGNRFWESLGFKEVSRYMRVQKI